MCVGALYVCVCVCVGGCVCPQEDRVECHVTHSQAEYEERELVCVRVCVAVISLTVCLSFCCCC